MHLIRLNLNNIAELQGASAPRPRHFLMILDRSLKADRFLQWREKASPRTPNLKNSLSFQGLLRSWTPSVCWNTRVLNAESYLQCLKRHLLRLQVWNIRWVSTEYCTWILSLPWMLLLDRGLKANRCLQWLEDISSDSKIEIFAELTVLHPSTPYLLLGY